MNQPELNFADTAARDGLSAWHAQRKAAIRELAARLGIPLGERVEVWLRDGVRLRGELRPREETLFPNEGRCYEVELEVEGVAFKHADIESCVVLG